MIVFFTSKGCVARVVWLTFLNLGFYSGSILPHTPSFGLWALGFGNQAVESYAISTPDKNQLKKAF